MTIPNPFSHHFQPHHRPVFAPFHINDLLLWFLLTSPHQRSHQPYYYVNNHNPNPNNNNPNYNNPNRNWPNAHRNNLEANSSPNTEEDAVSDEQPQWSFLQVVFSFLFGEGNPNVDFREKQLLAIGKLIRHNNGVVLAEQVRLFLDDFLLQQPEKGSKNETKETYEVENWFMAPIMKHFGGEVKRNQSNKSLM